MACLGRLPELMRRGRVALKQSNSTYSRNDAVYEVQRDVSALYETYQPVLEKLRKRWRDIDTNVMCNASFTTVQKRTLHCHCSRVLALGLAIGIVINRLWSAVGNGYPSLQLETRRMAEEILELDEVVRMYRPLGAMTMLLSLGAAWMSTSYTKIKDRIEAMAVDYIRDIDGSGAIVKQEDLDWFRM